MKEFEERFYKIAGEEVSGKRFAPAIYAKALSKAGGDEKKTIALYIKLRVKQLSQESVVHRDRRPDRPIRPTGLTVFAVMNFIFGCVALLSLFLISPDLREQAGIPLSPYTVLSPVITAALLIISGIGFLRMNYHAGFIGGVLFCILSLGNIIVFNCLRGFEGFLLHVPSMVYPLVLYLMLIYKYHDCFSTD